MCFERRLPVAILDLLHLCDDSSLLRLRHSAILLIADQRARHQKLNYKNRRKNRLNFPKTLQSIRCSLADGACKKFLNFSFLYVKKHGPGLTTGHHNSSMTATLECDCQTNPQQLEEGFVNFYRTGFQTWRHPQLLGSSLTKTSIYEGCTT